MRWGAVSEAACAAEAATTEVGSAAVADPSEWKLGGSFAPNAVFRPSDRGATLRLPAGLLHRTSTEFVDMQISLVLEQQ